ncbi:MAG: PorV/PorQ family protein [Sphingobacteriia bacterium]
MCVRLVDAQTSVPKYSNEFLKIGVSARAAGMGNALTAWTDDASSGYWNPALMVYQKTKHELDLMHSEYFAGVAKYDYAAFNTRIEGDRRLGFTFIRFGVDDIPNTLNFRDGNNFNYDLISSFSVADMALIMSYAQRIQQVKGLSLGGSFKVVNRIAGEFATAWGFGLDVAAAYQRDRLYLGLIASDVTSTFNAWTFNTETFEEGFLEANQEIPQNSVEITLPSARLGVGYRLLPEGKKIGLYASAQANLAFDGPRNVVTNLGRVSLDPAMGLEANYKGIVFARAGVMNFQYLIDEKNEKYLSAFPTAGVGISYWNISLDYALSNLSGFDLGLYSHLISLRIGFDALKL